MFSRQSLPSVMRQIEQALEDRSKPSAVPPVVAWQGCAENTAAFTLRMRHLRAQLPEAVRIFAGCSGPQTHAVAGVQWVEFPPKLFDQLHPSRKFRYRVAKGGRGGAKSWAYCRALLLRALDRKTRVLCFRETQTSIAESVHHTLVDQIEQLGMDPWFTVLKAAIFGANGSEFVFAGVRSDPAKIQSTEGIDIAHGEEAAGISNESWQILIPTIRRPGSEVWAVYNPNLLSDPTHQRFAITPPDNASVVDVSFEDNPWLPDVLKAEEQYLRRVDPDAHAHVWLGQPRSASDAQILAGKYVIKAFEPGEGWSLYQGADWGFAQDPTTLIRCWVHDRTLYVEHEAYAIGCELDRLPALFDAVPDARLHVTRADSSRPETINHMQGRGYPRLTAVIKWQGSVEDGIAFLRQFERIVIHPRCVHTTQEARLYTYKVDKLSGDILPQPVDKHNHCWDAIRYALQPLIRRMDCGGFFEWMRIEAERIRAGNLEVP